MIYLVDYIYSGGTFGWAKTNRIDTGIFASSETEIRVVYKGAGINVDRIAGFSQEGNSSDDNDFRVFYYSNGSFDIGSSRTYLNFPLITNYQLYDYSFGFNDNNKKAYLYNNISESYVIENYTYVSSVCTTEGIKIDVGGQYVNRIQIKNDGVVVFDGYAAIDSDTNTIGLYDIISKTLVTNSNLNLTYGEIIGGLSISISIDSIESTTESGSSSVTITTEDSWSVSTQDSWITISQSSGVGTTTILVNWKNNIFQQRTGTVTFTDTTTQEEVELTITQDGNTLVPYKKIFINGNRIN